MALGTWRGHSSAAPGLQGIPGVAQPRPGSPGCRDGAPGMAAPPVPGPGTRGHLGWPGAGGTREPNRALQGRWQLLGSALGTCPALTARPAGPSQPCQARDSAAPLAVTVPGGAGLGLQRGNASKILLCPSRGTAAAQEGRRARGDRTRPAPKAGAIQTHPDPGTPLPLSPSCASRVTGGVLSLH